MARKKMEILAALPEEAIQELSDPAFTKEQIIACRRYSDKRDLLNAILTDGQKYTFSQADEMIQNFLKKEVE